MVIGCGSRGQPHCCGMCGCTEARRDLTIASICICSSNKCVSFQCWCCACWLVKAQESTPVALALHRQRGATQSSRPYLTSPFTTRRSATSPTAATRNATKYCHLPARLRRPSIGRPRQDHVSSCAGKLRYYRLPRNHGNDGD